jgi:hypothetical protein
MSVKSELRGLAGLACLSASRVLYEQAVDLIGGGEQANCCPPSISYDDGYDYEDEEVYINDPRPWWPATLADVAPSVADARDWAWRRWQHASWLAMARASGRKGAF